MGHLDPFRQALERLTQQLIDFLPSFFAAFLLILVGWLISRLLATTTRRIARRMKLDQAMEKAGWPDALERAGVEIAPSAIVGRLVFWIVFLVFVALAVETLGFGFSAVPVRAFVEYLPRVLGAVLLLFLGAVLAGVLSKAFSAALARLEFAQHRMLASIVQGLILLVTFLAVFDQLGFDVTFLSSTLGNLLAIFAAAFAVTFALGGRDVARNMLAGYYARERFQAGDRLQMSEGTGELTGIGTLSAVIQTEKGEFVIPNHRLVESSIVKLESDR